MPSSKVGNGDSSTHLRNYDQPHNAHRLHNSDPLEIESTSKLTDLDIDTVFTHLVTRGRTHKTQLRNLCVTQDNDVDTHASLEMKPLSARDSHGHGATEFKRSGMPLRLPSHSQQGKASNFPFCAHYCNPNCVICAWTRCKTQWNRNIPKSSSGRAGDGSSQSGKLDLTLLKFLRHPCPTQHGRIRSQTSPPHSS